MKNSTISDAIIELAKTRAKLLEPLEKVSYQPSTLDRFKYYADQAAKIDKLIEGLTAKLNKTPKI